MPPRVTLLNFSTLALIGCALVLGVLVGRVELFLAGVPLLVALAGARIARAPGDCTVVHEVSSARLLEGDRLTVTASITARAPISLLEVTASLPPLVRVRAGRPRAVFSLEPGEVVQWRYELECIARGRLTVGAAELRAWDRGGFRVVESRHIEAHRVNVYPRTEALRSLPRPRRTQTFAGDYVARDLGEGLEPGDIRVFVPGDRVKHVNWRASLRRDRLYVTQYQQEKNADVVLMLDTLAEVGARPATTLDLCVRAAASLAAAYLARKDRVGLVEYGGLVRWVKPGSGRAHYERLLAALLDAEVIFTYVAKDLALVPPRILPPQSLVIALSPLVDARFVKAAINLASRGFDVEVLAVSPIWATRNAGATSRETELACRLWALERRVQLDTLRRQGLTVVEWDPESPLQLSLARHATARRPRRMVPA